MAIHESHKIGGTYGNACEACGCGSQTLTAESPCVPTAEGAAFAWAGTPDCVQSLAAMLAPREGERTQTIDGRRVAIRSNRAWRELAESALQVAMSAQARILGWKAEARLMDNVRGAAVRETEALRREKRGLESELSEAREALAEWKRKADKAAGDCLTYREQRDAQSARAVKAEQLAESRRAEAAEFRIKLDSLYGRTVEAERQLAEYRAACAPIPYGAARAYPAAASLMRIYLADLDKEGAE